ncbi:hypothetical protein M758_9G111500 [Ceratodon purpureus]|nr:hypothetical protein M758_9G111500 [Ceratodon purpureus]
MNGEETGERSPLRGLTTREASAKCSSAGACEAAIAHSIQRRAPLPVHRHPRRTLKKRSAIPPRTPANCREAHKYQTKSRRECRGDGSGAVAERNGGEAGDGVRRATAARGGRGERRGGEREMERRGGGGGGGVGVRVRELGLGVGGRGGW